MHIHIDPVGGIAGDMFVAAMLDLFPKLQEKLLNNLRSVVELKAIDVQVLLHNDSVLRGKQFNVADSGFDHQHSHYSNLQKIILSSSIPAEVKTTANRILSNLAKAEASVHGVEIDQVTLHEVGSPDSLTDIISAAFLIVESNVSSWSCASLPSGNGKVDTAHGELPLPAPAVVELLKGYPVHNDGRTGERVTPTGAAILRTIEPKFDARRSTMSLVGAGHGFGRATFEGISNVLRLTAFEESSNATQFEKITVLTFEVDDQSPEDLSIGLERLRMSSGVLDVVQFPAIGKKGRMTAHIQVLALPELVEEVASRCTLETATIGVRVQTVDRIVLKRTSRIFEESGTAVPVKVVERPDGLPTAKVEADHLAEVGSFRERKTVKQTVEHEAEKGTQNSKR